MTEYKMQLEDWLDDLCVRFVINLPKEDLSSVERICFQVEEAQWFYEDFIRPLDPALPSMSLRSFCLRIFQHCPLLSIFSQEHHMQAFEEFLMYKNRIPVRGAIMLNHAMDSAVLVKGWKKAAAWSFPRGKISKDEDDLDCAIREVYEETGFNIREAGLVPQNEEAKFIDIPMREQHIRLYVFRDVPMDTHFEPRTRKEISKIDWFKLSELPAFRKKNTQAVDQAEVAKNANKFYMVAPFLVPLKKWVQQQKQNESKRIFSNGSVQNQYNDDIQTEEEGFRSSVDAVDARNARNSSERLDTMEGATAALQQLLKIQPPTQGLQGTSSPAASATGRNTGNDLLALLRGKQPVGKPASPPSVTQPQSVNGFMLRQPAFSMQPPQQQQQQYPGPHIVLDQARQPIVDPARDMRSGQLMMPQPFAQIPQQGTAFGRPPVLQNSNQQYPRPPPGMQQTYRQPVAPTRDVTNIQMQMPQTISQAPVNQSYNQIQPPRIPPQQSNNSQPMDAHRTALLNAFSMPSAPQPRQNATSDQPQLPRNPLQQNNIPPMATSITASVQSANKVQEAPQPVSRQPQMPQIPLARAPPTSVSIPVIDPDAPRPRQRRPEADNNVGRRTPRSDRRINSRPQSTEKPVPFKPTAILARPQQAASRDITPQPASPAVPTKVEARNTSPERPDVHEIARKQAQRQEAPPVAKPFAPKILKRPETKLAEQEAAAAVSAAPAQPAVPSPAVLSPPITAAVTAALAGRKPSYTTTNEQKNELLSMFKSGDAKISAPEQPKPDIRSLFKAPEQPKPTAPQQKNDLLSMIKAQEKKHSISDQKQELLSLLKSPNTKPIAPQTRSEVPPISLKAERRPSADSFKADLLAQFRAPERRPSTGSEHKDNLLAQFKAPERRPSTGSEQKDALLAMFTAPEMKKSASQSSQQKQDSLSRFQATERRPSSSDKKMDLLSMFQPQVSKPAVIDQQKQDLLSMMRGRDPLPASVPKRDVFDLSRFRSSDARAPAPALAPEKAQLLSMLSGGQPRQPPQQPRTELLSMLNSQQQPQQQPQQQQFRTTPQDPQTEVTKQKAQLLSLMGQPSQPPQDKRDMYAMFNKTPDNRTPAPSNTNYNLLALLKGQDSKPTEPFNSAFGGQRPAGFGGENQAGTGPLPPFPMRRPSDEGGQAMRTGQGMQGHGQGQDKGFLLNYLNGLGKGGI